MADSIVSRYSASSAAGSAPTVPKPKGAKPKPPAAPKKKRRKPRPPPKVDWRTLPAGGGGISAAQYRQWLNKAENYAAAAFSANAHFGGAFPAGFDGTRSLHDIEHGLSCLKLWVAQNGITQRHIDDHINALRKLRLLAPPPPELVAATAASEECELE